MKPPARFLLLLALLPQLLVLGLGGDLVLCLAPGGHVEIELAASGCCVDELGPSEGATDRASEDDCGPCRDLPVLVDSGVSSGGERVRSTQAAQALPPLAAIGLATVCASPASRSCSIRAPRAPDPVRSARSVVLRC